MPTELELLKEQNLMLNEQVKLLIRTEKQLYRAHKNSQQHLNLIRSLSEFSLRCSNEIEVNIILSNAMDLLCSIYPFDVGAAAIIVPELNVLNFSSFEKGRAPTSSSFDIIQAGLDPRALGIESHLPLIAHLHQQEFNRQFHDILKVMKNAALPLDSQVSRDFLQSANTLIPLHPSSTKNRGFLIVGCQLETLTTIHSKLPVEEDIPFLSLLQGHIQAALGNAAAHYRQRNFTHLLEQKVEQKTKELQRTQSILMETSRKAGISEIATNILHNVGNVLNSVTTSSSQVTAHLSSMHLDSMAKCSELLVKGEPVDAKEFSRLLFELHNQFEMARTLAFKEINWLNQNIEHIKQIVNAQQSLAMTPDILERCSLQKIIGDAFQIVQSDIKNSAVNPRFQYALIPDFWMDRHRLLQIMVNLIRNAVESLSASPKTERLLEVSTEIQSDTKCIIRVADNGIGIRVDHLTKIFGQGFTTKSNGHGFGLHASANAAAQMGGRLHALSEGIGKGACFILEIPFAPNQVDSIAEVRQ